MVCRGQSVSPLRAASPGRWAVEMKGQTHPPALCGMRSRSRQGHFSGFQCEPMREMPGVNLGTPTLMGKGRPVQARSSPIQKFKSQERPWCCLEYMDQLGGPQFSRPMCMDHRPRPRATAAGVEGGQVESATQRRVTSNKQPSGRGRLTRWAWPQVFIPRGRRGAGHR